MRREKIDRLKDILLFPEGSIAGSPAEKARSLQELHLSVPLTCCSR